VGGSSTHAVTAQHRTVRYAPYVEAHHEAFLDATHNKVLAVVEGSPYANYTAIDVDNAFFSVGLAISDYPSLHDIFGKYMSGFDIEVLWSYIFGDIFNASEINAFVSSEMVLVDDGAVKRVLSEFQIAMRDTNSVITSSFVIGKSMVESARLKALSGISSMAKFQLIPSLSGRFVGSLRWNQSLITAYAEAMKLYYMTKMYIGELNYKLSARDSIWPFTVMDFERAAIGALRGAVSFAQTLQKRGRSTISTVLNIGSYTVQGLVLGATIGGLYGAIIGAVIGFIVGVALTLLE
jgi:hypothetical protein